MIEERAITTDKLQMQAHEWTMEEPDRPPFLTFYIDQGAIFGLFGWRAELWRAGLDWDEQENLIVGELQSVLTQFTPVNQSGFTVMRQADGRLRFFMIAGTAVLNRVGQIDSTRLYDDMISRAKETGFYPVLDYWHLGGVDPLLEFGQFDYLAREGICYVGSGLLDDGHPLTEATIKALEREPAKWGASIEYYRPLERGLEYLELGDGVEIAIFTEGLNTRISLLPEASAACWFTSFNTETVMRDVDLQKLRELFSEDEDGYNRFVAQLQRTNETVAEQGLIAREAGNPEAEEPEATEEAGEIEIDDAAIEAISRQAAETMAGELTPITEGVTQLRSAVEALTAQLNGMSERLQALEADEEVQREIIQQDMPQRRTTVTYRPRDAHKDENDGKERAADVQAQNVLSSLPSIGNL